MINITINVLPYFTEQTAQREKGLTQGHIANDESRTQTQLFWLQIWAQPTTALVTAIHALASEDSKPHLYQARESEEGRT